ncbi:MAG: hypothetical protein BMS9Abin37_0933 [Acidobacteriota bacterium]|nr:MAG: hypothetical protein BMS9Abin37_0933 [Acidobacteriota bacterium]
MQDAVLNLCRVKLRDQQRLAHGPLTEYPQYPNGKFGDAVPRARNASGGGQPGWIVKCKGWETDPDAYIYVITQVAAFNGLAKAIGHEEWLEDPEWNTPKARLPKLDEMFDEIEKWTMTKNKMEVMDILNPLNVPCGPILSMKEIGRKDTSSPMAARSRCVSRPSSASTQTMSASVTSSSEAAPNRSRVDWKTAHTPADFPAASPTTASVKTISPSSPKKPPSSGPVASTRARSTQPRRSMSTAAPRATRRADAASSHQYPTPRKAGLIRELDAHEPRYIGVVRGRRVWSMSGWQITASPGRPVSSTTRNEKPLTSCDAPMK